MIEQELNELKEMGCDIDYDPLFLADEGYFDILYTISYKGIYVGSDRSTFEFVKKQVDKIDSIFEDGFNYGARMGH